MLFFKHCLLNLWRAPRRTVLLFTLLACGLAALFLVNSYRYGLYQLLADSFRVGSGDFQIGRTESLGGNYNARKELISEEQYRQLKDILANKPYVLAADPTLSFQGLLGDQKGSLIVGGVGTDPEVKNRGIAKLGRLVMGQALSNEQPQGMVLGKGLLESLEVGEQSPLSLLTSTERGALSPANVEVRGAISTGASTTENSLVLLPLDYVQQVRNTRKIETLQVFVDPRSSKLIPELMAELRDTFQRNNWPLRSMTWRELHPFYDQLRDMYDMLFLLVLLIVAPLVVIATFESLTMTFWERMRELGTLRAVGNTRAQIFAQLAVEISLLTLGGIILGIALSFLLGAGLNKIEIPFTPPGRTESVPLYFPLRYTYLIQPMLLLSASAFLSGLWPAIAATRMKVVEVLRHG